MKNTGYLTVSRKGRAFALFLFAALTAGIIAGSVYGASHPHGLTAAVHQFYLPGSCGRSFPAVFGNTLLSSALFLTAAYLAGLFTFGQPVGIALLVYRGFGIGASSAAMYSSDGIGAAAGVTLRLMPFALASAGIAVLAVRELLRVSSGVLCLWVTGELRDEKLIDLKLYTTKFAVLMLLSLIISLANGAVFLACSGIT
ncbi:MAG: hypothetical protein IKO47_10055 [Ruminococcus sp.]|nr:hypothetical protein [Ruminococcus sp.]